MAEVLGTCEHCGGLVAADHERTVWCSFFWHKGCADVIRNRLHEADEVYPSDADLEDPDPPDSGEQEGRSDG